MQDPPPESGGLQELIVRHWKSVVLSLLVALAVLMTFGPRWFDGFAAKLKYVHCEKLPGAAKARQIFAAHKETVRAIEQVHPGGVRVVLDDFTCPGRADLHIYYASEYDRREIEKIISGKTFFGLPYRLTNW